MNKESGEEKLKNEAKRLRATTIAIAKLIKVGYCCPYIGKI